MTTEVPEAAPRLEVVDDAAPRPAAAPAPRSRERETRLSRRTFRLLVALLLLAAVAVVVQTRRVGSLEGRVEGLGSELSAARQQLGVYEGQLGRVRGVVDDLGTRLEELRALLEQDPARPGAPEEAL